MKRILLSLLLPIVLCGVHDRAFARAGLDSIGSHSIDEIIFYGNRIDRETVPAQVLAGKELRRLSAVSVADAIRYFSGVQIKDYGGTGGLKTVNIRSMGSHHVGVFYDGVQLGNAQNGTIDLGRFSMDNMEAISLYNGQKSNVFQTARDFSSASAIYMTTRKPLFENGKRYNLKLTLKSGSFETVNPSLLWERRLAEHLDVQLSAEYMHSEGWYKFRSSKKDGYDTTQVRLNGDVRALRVEGGLFGKLKKGDWRAKVYFYDSDRGYPGYVKAGEPGKYYNEERQKDRNIFVQSSLRQYFGAYSVMLNAKYAYDMMLYAAPVENILNVIGHDDLYYQQEAYVSAANEFVLTGWWKIGLSSDFQYNKLDARLLNDPGSFVYPSRFTSLTAAASAFDLKRFRAQASILYTHVTDRTRKQGGQAGDKNEWTPTAIVMYRPFERADLSFRAFYKRIFRMPTFNDLYYVLIGNKYLDPEYTTQYDLGAVYTKDIDRGCLRRLEVQLDGYFNQVTDKIVAVPASGQFRWTMMNLGYVEIRGIDAAVQTDIRLGRVDVRARLSYTFQKAQNLTEDNRPDPDSGQRPGYIDRTTSYYGAQIPYVPRHSGSAIVGAAWKDWDFNYSFIYNSERYKYSAGEPVNRMPPWYTHDLSLSKAIRLENSELRITAEVNNIFNQQFEVVQCYPMPGINFKIKIAWTI